MKILKIFGVVVAVHAAVFMFIFAIPGCRSTGKQSPASTGSDGPPNSATVNYAGGTGTPTTPPSDTGGALPGSDLNPAITPAFDPNAPASAGVRFSPTRPGSPVAGVVQTQPVTDVQPAESYTVAKGDSLWSVAKKHGITVAELTKANNLSSSAAIRLGQKLIIPGKIAATAAPAPTSQGATASSSSDTQTYTVKSGDTLAGVARRAGLTTATLKAMNNLKGDILRAGQVLTLPAGSGVGHTTSAPVEAVAKPARGAGVTHVVRNGETLGSVAKKYQVSVGEIATANNISDPAKIRPGQELMIPGWQSPGGKTASANPPPPALSRTPPANPPTNTIPLFTVPPADQDLDAGLKKDAPDVPVIKVEDTGAPKIE